MTMSDERVTGQSAPGGQVGRGARIESDELEHAAGGHFTQKLSESQDEVAAAELAGVPARQWDGRSVMSRLGRGHRLDERGRAGGLARHVPPKTVGVCVGGARFPSRFESPNQAVTISPTQVLGQLIA